MSAARTLTPADVEAVAEAVVRLLRPKPKRQRRQMPTPRPEDVARTRAALQRRGIRV